MGKETDKGFRKIEIPDDIERAEIFGSMDKYLSEIEDAAGVEIVQRNGDLLVKGDDESLAAGIIEELTAMVRKGETIDDQKVNYVISLKKGGISYKENHVESDIICFTMKGKPIRPRTIGQKNYIKSLEKRDVVFAIGPAGTGKTYLAVAMAVKAYRDKLVDKIILARPAVEAGESLGFLPGDLQEKVDPYLRPLYDALYDIMGRDKVISLKEKEVIEIVPLAYMRGRTLDNAYIILDEAQNATREQMKMFLTRMGFGSKVVVTGDVTQIDLPEGKRSGLKDAMYVLKNVKGIDFCFLNQVDVVRHEMVKRIIEAYDESDKKRAENKDRRRNGNGTGNHQ